MAKKLYTLRDIDRLKKLFTKDDLALAVWLRRCPDELVEMLLDIIRKQITNAVVTDCFLHDNNLINKEVTVKKRLRPYLSVLFVFELKRYSAHSFHFLSDKPSYDKILSKVLTKVFRRHGQTYNLLNSTIEEEEKTLTDLIFTKGSSPSTSINKTIIDKSSAFLIKVALKKVTLPILKRFTPAVGWALLAKDIYDLGGEADRVTVPFVISIAYYRSLETIYSQTTATALKIKS